MRTLTIWIAVLAMSPLIADPPREKDPVAIFAELDGTWKGTFVGFDESGRELYRIRVEQVYETVDARTQKVRIKDSMPDGTVITGAGENTANRREDGTLELKCVVRKSNGEQVEHEGRVVKGPDGDHQVIWYSKRPGKVETFRESVRREGDQTIYSINGMGHYGETLILMNGRYRKS